MVKGVIRQRTFGLCEQENYNFTTTQSKKLEIEIRGYMLSIVYLLDRACWEMEMRD